MIRFQVDNNDIIHTYIFIPSLLWNPRFKNLMIFLYSKFFDHWGPINIYKTTGNSIVLIPQQRRDKYICIISLLFT